MTGAGYFARLAAFGLLLAAGWAAAAPARAADAVRAYPDDAEAHRIIGNAPVIQAAQELRVQGSARQRLERAGPHEWTVSVSSRRRTDAVGLTYSEQEYGLARGFRLPGKGSLDRKLGVQAVASGEYAFEDAWHEAGRMLLSRWFEWLRAGRSAGARQQLHEMRQRLATTAEHRLRAGDIPLLESRLAAVELQRAAVDLAAARQAVERARIELLKEFPDARLVAPETLPEPVALTESDDVWIQRVVGANHEIKLADSLAEEANLQARRARLDRLADPIIGLHFSDNVDANRRLYMLNISVPLGGAARGAAATLARSSASARSAEARQAALRVQGDARQDLVSAHSSYRQWLDLRDAAQQSRSVASGFERGYANGEFGMVELLNAQQLAVEAVLGSELAQLDALEAAARLHIDAHLMWTPD